MKLKRGVLLVFLLIFITGCKKITSTSKTTKSSNITESKTSKITTKESTSTLTTKNWSSLLTLPTLPKTTVTTKPTSTKTSSSSNSSTITTNKKVVVNSIQELREAIKNNIALIELGHDIDANNYDYFTPENIFTGTIDGKGHKISGLTIVGKLEFTLNSSNKIITKSTYSALVSTADGATFKNLTFVDTTIKAYERSAVVAGVVKGNVLFENIYIENVKVILMYDVDYHGALIGRISDGNANVLKVTINKYQVIKDNSEVLSYVAINGNTIPNALNEISTDTSTWGAYGGMLVGGIDAQTEDGLSSLEINNLYLYGEVNMSDQAAGGIIGRAQGPVTINNAIVNVSVGSPKNVGAIGGDFKNVNLKLKNVILLSSGSKIIGKEESVNKDIINCYSLGTDIFTKADKVYEEWYNGLNLGEAWIYNPKYNAMTIRGHIKVEGSTNVDDEEDIPAEFSDTDNDALAVGTPFSSNSTYANVPNISVNTIVINENDIVVAPNLSTTGDGTLENPTTLDDAINRLKAGNKIFLLEGTYYFSGNRIRLNKNGTRSKYLHIVAYNSGEVIFNFSGQKYNSDTGLNERGIQIEGNFWYIFGITVTGSADNGIFISGNYNIVENCVLHSNRDTGLQISRRASTLNNFNQWPHDNLIRYCTSYNNADTKSGENADGFAAKLTCGNNNTFDHCISYNNSDDGWDLYAKSETGPIGRVIILNCVAFNNGMLLNGSSYSDGDKNGFKLGGADIKGNHYVYNSIAFRNGNHGFTDNSNSGPMTLINCTSFQNARSNSGKANWDMNRDNLSENYSLNILAVTDGSTASDKYGGTGEYMLVYNSKKYYYVEQLMKISEKNSGTRGMEYTLLSSSSYTNIFKSITPPDELTNIHKNLRNSDLTINLGDFLRVNELSVVYTLGKDAKPLGANLHETSYQKEESYQKVIRLIDEIGLVERTEAIKNKIDIVKALYLNLSSLEKDLVNNYQVLEDAINNYQTLEKIYVEELIENIGIISKETVILEYPKLLLANKEYQDLDEAVKEMISNKDKLDKANSDYEACAVNAIISLIDNIGLVTLEKVAYIYDIRKAYNDLTSEKKLLITNLDVLIDAEEELENLKKINEVINLILLIPETITLKDKVVIDNASNAFNNLSIALQERITNKELLVQALDTLNKLLSDGVIFDPSGLTIGSISAEYQMPGGIFAIGSLTDIKKNDASFSDDKKLSICVDLNGAPKTAYNTDRYIKFNINKDNATLTIYAKGASSERILELRDSLGQVIASQGLINESIITFTNVPKGSYYLVSKSSGIKIYQITIN